MRHGDGGEGSTVLELDEDGLGSQRRTGGVRSELGDINFNVEGERAFGVAKRGRSERAVGHIAFAVSGNDGDDPSVRSTISTSMVVRCSTFVGS
jgi:hypothetical protein